MYLSASCTTVNLPYICAPGLLGIYPSWLDNRIRHGHKEMSSYMIGAKLGSKCFVGRYGNKRNVNGLTDVVEKLSLSKTFIHGMERVDLFIISPTSCLEADLLVWKG